MRIATELSRFQKYNDLVHIHFDQNIGYLENNRKGLREMTRKLDQRIRRFEKKYPDSFASIENDLQSDIAKYGSATFNPILNETTFINSYSLFESLLKKLCDLAAEQVGMTFRPKDLGNFAESCTAFLESEMEIDLSALKPSLKELKIYRQIQSRLVHKEQEKKMDPQLENFLSGNTHFRLRNAAKESFYIYDPQFVIEFCDLANKYLSTISQKLDKRFPPR